MSSDPVLAFLRRRGLADEIVAGGVEGLVARWEQAAREAERDPYPFGVEDWLDELDVRQTLHELHGELPGAIAGADAARLAEADARVIACTALQSDCLWGASLAARMRWQPAIEWWYWRRPRAVNEDF